MYRILKFPLLLLLLAVLGCSDASAPTGSEESATVIAEQGSVMRGYDSTDPQGSMDALAAGSSTSNIVFETKSVDLGKTYQKHKYPLSFPFVIEGGDPVVITTLDPSCGCTEAKIKINGEIWPLGREIPPGTKGEISAVFDGASYRRTKASTIKIRGTASNLPDSLKLETFVLPVFELKPNPILFGDVMYGDLRDNDPEITVEVIGMEPFEVTRWKTVPEGITIQEKGEPTLDEEGKRQTRHFTFRLERNAPAGRMFKSAIAETTLDIPLQITMRATITGPIQYLPEQRLSFGLVNEGETPQRLVTIKANTEQVNVPSPIINIDGKAAKVMTHTLVEKEAGRSYVVRVKLNEDVAFGRYPGSMTVSYPEGSGIESHTFPLSATVRKRR